MKGKLYIVGVGPGSPEMRTIRAVQAIKESNVIVAYTTYADLVKDLTDGKEVITARMKEEIYRARTALEKAMEGNVVSLISSGDPQVYGMAGITLEMMYKNKIQVDFEVIPGVTAGLAAASRLGSPLSMDFASISLSDLLVPAEDILFRVRKAAEADFVIVLYNPINKPLLEKAMKIISEYRKPETPVGIVKGAYRESEEVFTTTLSNWREYEDKINMITTVVVGNSRSYLWGNRILTPRGYERKYSLDVNT
ncbi:precorrin-3B C(17)-methyltransferase [Sulfolobus acidocaldarius]|uniref:Methylase n=4 Tax=Sulfolobus acidocaldarius TaxID=2285 RepID=Q4JBL5_SULAC|nr:precorrin-3B C(17)-methyltransferase [Sulfolobus acidocaldarius]AAY79814.1 methylase [Sulfolobus acidocaldarius DSM 639]AGE70373.1 precorrin-3B C17-methyltransferase [Sulfolobus acidocaldarius N8]AGE72647.1 precorrin-3B C17-methyltransferase [Sulfolobus acidocaldarius Ron12/I]ALU31959.1 cobalt-precorrin-3B C(17)-methyltransferase [Sulfolobus acidocaldarius]WCM34380.1 precorrin-3B C(17)-methyltransferase [Sulfolobus acidocaldarius DSM 639]